MKASALTTAHNPVLQNKEVVFMPRYLYCLTKFLFIFRAIPTEVSITVKISKIKYLEHVQVKVNLTFKRRGDLYLELEGPSGTTSPLTRQRRIDNLTLRKNLTNWVITSLFHWGENPEGQWKLKIGNLDPSQPNTGKLLYTVEPPVRPPQHTL